MQRLNRHILSVAAIAIMSGCASSDRTPDTSSSPDAGPADPKAAQAALSDPKVVAELRDLALQASSRAGVPSPKTMVAVAASDHQAAEMVLSGAIISDHAPVYVIEMTGGTFTATGHPPGGAAPQGNVLTLTVDATTHSVTDIGYVDEEPDLDKIGSVQVDLLAE
jgi:hypothetical protein